MSQPRDDRQDDLFRSPLEAIINLRHPLVRIAAEINWDFLAKRFSSVCRVGRGSRRGSWPGSSSQTHAQSLTRRCATRAGSLLHAKALHGNPYDGHTLGPIIADLEKLTGLPSGASTATRAIAVTTIRTGSRSGSPARSGVSPRPFAARCDVVLPSSP